MQVEWYGQSAFRLSAGETTVAIDPFGDMSALSQGRGLQWDYPAIDGVTADLLIVTHEHRDHNAVETIGGDPVIVRSLAGTFDSPVGQVTSVASEHDERAGTERGHNTIACFELDGMRVCHMGDLGQVSLRDEQIAAIGSVELLFVPVGGMATIGAEAAAEVVARLQPRLVVPMHYRTPRIGFLETADEFLSRFERVVRLQTPTFDTSELADAEAPTIVVPAAP